MTPAIHDSFDDFDFVDGSFSESVTSGEYGTLVDNLTAVLMCRSELRRGVSKTPKGMKEHRSQ